MPHRSRRGAPEVFEFVGEGDEAVRWLDAVYGTSLRMTGPLGVVRHHREDHGTIAFDHMKIDADFSFDSDAMPALLVVDVFGGVTEYTRDGMTDRIVDGDTALVAGWDMPFAGRADHQDIRATTVTGAALMTAVEEVAPDYPWEHITFTSYVPHSPAAGARWRAIVDQLSSMLPPDASPAQSDAAARLLGHTLLQTFPNNVVVRADHEVDRDPADDAPSTVRRAVRIIEQQPAEELSPADLARECGVTPRTLQYAFRQHLGCTPQDYLRRIRLDLARRSMREGTVASVSDAAASYGFFNPGRFAADYRQVFHENPGQTLHRSDI
ncbi:helix-turn-helix domain-containing protein [Nocardioides sp.]|uniref:AraC family transcriptional regulator n=1 Tax=Nocardioides sp. TaxID=35761 RepID=UPI00260C1A11|nr:helix-turn-helix domain-containing protein [Nocardioides sp.]MCW2736295.1 AraC-type DNA-binding protein [Nocardioides sp.]